ncbi:unnamed protein product, partial [Heterotrigona itama]
KLPRYKARNKLVQEKRKSFLKCSNMSSLNRSRSALENNPVPEDSLNRKQLLLQCNLKQKEKKPANIKGPQRKEFTRSSKTLFDRVHKRG